MDDKVSGLGCAELSPTEHANCAAIIAACEGLPRKERTLLACDAVLLAGPTREQLAEINIARLYVQGRATDEEIFWANIRTKGLSSGEDRVAGFRDRAIREAIYAAFCDEVISVPSAHAACNAVPFTARTLEEREDLHARIALLAEAYTAS